MGRLRGHTGTLAHQHRVTRSDRCQFMQANSAHDQSIELTAEQWTEAKFMPVFSTWFRLKDKVTFRTLIVIFLYSAWKYSYLYFLSQKSTWQKTRDNDRGMTLILLIDCGIKSHQLSWKKARIPHRDIHEEKNIDCATL